MSMCLCCSPCSNRAGALEVEANYLKAFSSEVSMPIYAPTKSERCHTCGNDKNLKTGWTNASYCSEQCERSHVSKVHASMPGGKLPRRNWVPHHISIEITRRWEDE